MFMCQSGCWLTVRSALSKVTIFCFFHRRFEESHLGKIKTVYPSAYTFRQEKNIPSFSATAKRSSYQLTVEPVIEEGENFESLLKNGNITFE